MPEDIIANTTPFYSGKSICDEIRPFTRECAELVLDRTRRAEFIIPQVISPRKESTRSSKWDNVHFQKQIEDIQRFQRSFAPSRSMRYCGLTPIQRNETQLTVYECKENKLRASFSGLRTCDNSLCATCAPSKEFERNQLIKKALTFAENNGYCSYFLTLTMDKSLSLGNSFKVLKDVYRKIILRDTKQRLKRRGHEVFEACLGADLTINENSKRFYHPHLHIVIITDKEDTSIESYVWSRYKKAMKTWGLTVSKNGYKMLRVNKSEGIDSYISKTFREMAFEITGARKKSSGAKQSQGIGEWIAVAAKRRSDRDIYLYRTILKETKGLRWFSQTKGFSDLCDESENNEPEEEDSVVYQVSIRDNVWYAINEIDYGKTRIIKMIINALCGDEISLNCFNKFNDLIKRTRYEIHCFPHKVDEYREDIKKILSQDEIGRRYA